jgi:hypothetical protein
VQVLQPRLSPALFRLYSPILRGANNLLGGVTFVMLAKAMGVQKAVEPVEAAPTRKSSNPRGAKSAKSKP